MRKEGGKKRIEDGWKKGSLENVAKKVGKGNRLKLMSLLHEHNGFGGRAA